MTETLSGLIAPHHNSHSLGKWPIIEVVSVVLITVLLSFHIPYTRMSGSELIALLFSECKNVNGDVNPLCDGSFDPVKHAGVIFRIALQISRMN